MSDIPINLTGELTPDEKYLWDATGTPAPSTVAIESALSQFRHSGKALTLERSPGLGFKFRRWPLLALAAGVILAVSLAVYFTARPPAPEYAGWKLAASTGKPSFGSGKVSKSPDAHVTTDAVSSATLEYKQGPTLKLGASTDATLTSGASVYLAGGKADVEVPPAVLPATVTTPSIACTVAPGSAASIESANGISQVRVISGWAEVASGDEKVRLADSMACSSQPKSGTIWPPYRVTKDVNANDLAKRLDKVLSQKIDEKSQYFLLKETLQKAQPQDAALLWNILPRLSEFQREPVRDRLAKLVKNPPRGAAYDAVIKLDKDAMDSWWNAIVAK